MGGRNAHPVGLVTTGHGQHKESLHDSVKHLNVPRETFLLDISEKFARRFNNICVMKMTSSGLVELLQPGVFCACCPEDSLGEDIVEIQTSRLLI